jgi:hypothetical protein
MEHDPIGGWIRSLSVSSRRRRAICRELRAHVVESQRELERAGWTRAEAVGESIRRLGNPDEIVEGFSRAYQPSRRRRVGLAFGLGVALFAGAYGASGTLASATAARARHAPAQTIHRPHHCNQSRQRDSPGNTHRIERKPLPVGFSPNTKRY